jgi:hypothetical protein
MALAASPEYVEYSYKLRCDHYRMRIRVSHLALLLPYRKLRDKVRESAYDTAEFFAHR